MKKITNIKFALLAIFAGLFLTASTQAATYTVDRTDDLTVSSCTAAAADCTLRGAIAAANANPGDDVIEFDAAVFSTPQTITLTQGQLSIANNGSLTINGTGADQLTVSGNNASRVFFINNGATATISGLTVTAARFTSDNGGGIVASNSSTLTLRSVRITGNFAPSGGGILALAGSTVNLSDSTVSNNNTFRAGGSLGGGIYNFQGTVNINNSTFSGNNAGFGGAIFNFNGTLTVNNSTVSGNTANFGGGISNGAFFFNGNGVIMINSTTISNNVATSPGGGVANFSSNTLTLNNTIIANSTSGGECARFGGTINAQYTLIEDNLICVNGTSSNNLTGDPNLGPLQNNGGSTFTHALLPGSIAIDAGNTGLTTDQRGISRPQGTADDIGAFEVETDDDGDGILNDMDNCPNTANADQADNDGDMIGDVCDDDDDNDGVLDVNDAFPFDPNESVDTDGDGIGNNADLDDDNDGQSDTNEMACGSNSLDAMSKSPDADGDNIPDCVDPDDDNDGIPDICDIDSNPGAVDFDRDGIVDGSGCDTLIGPPVDKDQCKNGGFMRFNNPTFSNQGQCVSFVESNRPR